MAILSALKFEQQIVGFLRRNRMKATNFGKVVMGDPNFVFDLRNGRAPSLRLVEAAQTYMAGQEILLKEVHALLAKPARKPRVNAKRSRRPVNGHAKRQRRK
jgi:hypothetical protein